MIGIILKLFLIAVGMLLTAYAAAHCFRSARHLNVGIEQFKREQEEAEKRGERSDPYAAMAVLYGGGEPVGEAAESRRSSKSGSD